MSDSEQPLLMLVEVLGRDGRVTQCVPVRHWPLRVGRAIDSDVVIDDSFVAPQHLVIDVEADNGPRLLALPSLNGVQMGGRGVPIGQAQALHTSEGTQLTLGHTTLRLRWPGEVLAPERPLRRGPMLSTLIVCLMLFWGLQAATIWLQLDPGAKVAEWLPALMTVPVGVAAWCGAWSLASKLFQQRPDFLGHLGIAAVYLLGIESSSILLPQVAAATSWDWLSRVAVGTVAAIGTAMVVAHVGLVLPQRRGLIRLLAAIGFAVIAAVTLTQNQQRNDRYFSELYTSTLPMPALRGAATLPVDEVLEVMPLLRQRVDANAKAAAQSDGPDDE